MGAYPTRDEHALARYGWASDFPVFAGTDPGNVVDRLVAFLASPSSEQVRAWRESIPPLQGEVAHIIDAEPAASTFGTVLEYELPLDLRRPDAVLLAGGAVFVLEFKSKARATVADVDQAATYARDLRAYHRACQDRPVYPLLVLTGARDHETMEDDVVIVDPGKIANVVETRSTASGEPISRDAFLHAGAYRPLPSLVEAARQLFEREELPWIRRAASCTDPTVAAIREIAEEAARTRSRRLVLVTGLPGSGKTLVGLQVAHARYLDDLAIERNGEKPTIPAVFLSGNGPLVSVLQYELTRANRSRDAKQQARAFVNGVKAYLKSYARNEAIPPEHVLIFDEAQRAFDADMVRHKHQTDLGNKSEPEHLIDFAERIPEWSVVVALIGEGQEINEGEESGAALWRRALEGASEPTRWTVHGAQAGLSSFGFEGYARSTLSEHLHLSSELRYHLATDLHEWVAGFLGDADPLRLRNLAAALWADGYRFRATRDLDAAKRYLRDRYHDDPLARFGMLASARDKDLERFGVPNSWNSTKYLEVGPWYVEGDDDPRARSCRALRTCVTEFSAQGLELDAALLAWGTDFIRAQGRWVNTGARRYRSGSLVKDPYRLRVNAHRVLLTRGRDATVIYVPPMGVLDETYAHILASGFVEL